MDCFYKVVDGNRWEFYFDGKFKRFSKLGLLYDKGSDFDTMLKHGSFEIVQSIFLSDGYSKLFKMGMDIRLIEVPLEMVDLLNKCISISASKWCSKLEDQILLEKKKVEKNECETFVTSEYT